MNVRKNIDYSEMFKALDHLMAKDFSQMELYCEIGKAVCRRTEKGAAVMASEYINKNYLDAKGYPNLVATWWDLNDLSRFVQALRGVFSGSVMQYYRRNKHFFDDAHEHGGLVLVLTDLCPFTKFQGYENESDPILLRDYDVTDKTMIQAFLLKSVSFADASYDYLVMLLADGEGKIIPNALKFPKRAFQCIQAELNGEEFGYIDDFTSPFPVGVTSDMLECFEGEFVLQEQRPNKQWLGQIGDIGEELWVYSKTRELLVDESDRQYLNDSLTTVKTKIEKMLGLLSTSADSEAESFIRGICSEVYSGEVFDDEKYNELIECIQAMSTIKDQ